MALNDRLRKVLSLSAASMALLQSAGVANGQPIEVASTSTDSKSKDGIQTKADSLILEPPHQKVLLYADHTSHSSHDSHSSHYSGTDDSGGYDYSTPAQTYAPPPAPPPPPPSPTEQVATNPVDISAMVSNPTSTNTVTTNSVADANAAANAADIELLTKAAAQGSASAQLALGIDYRDGSKGLPKNAERAKMLFEMSAIQGDTDGKLLLDDLNNSETQTNQTQTNNVAPP
jgi:hypothetical protein